MNPASWIILAIVIIIVGIALFILFKNKGRTCSCSKDSCGGNCSCCKKKE